MKRLTAVLFVVAGASAALAEFHRDIEYGRAGGERLLLDANVPVGPGPFPVAILIHGGGWSRGDKSGNDQPGNPADITPWFAPLTEAGFTWFSINYRLLPKHEWPAGFQDVQTAIRWVKEHAREYKGDPTRIVLFGHSAGGHLAALTVLNSTRDTRVQAAVLFAPSTDYPPDAPRRPTLSSRLTDVLFPPAGMSPEDLAVTRDPWPIDHVTAFTCPILVVHGDADRTVPLARSFSFLARLSAAGATCDLTTIKGGPHSLIDATKIDPSHRPAIFAWLGRTLTERPAASKPRVDLTVAADGSGDFSSVQQAIDSIPSGNTTPRTILVKEGIYGEHVRLDRNHITLRGESRRSTRLEPPLVENTFSRTISPISPALIISGLDCTVENLSIANPHGTADLSAPVIESHGDRVRITDCDLGTLGEGAITLRNPQGRCYVADSIFWSLASGAKQGAIARVRHSDHEPFVVIRNVRFEGKAAWHLWSPVPNANGRFFLLNCRFAASMQDAAGQERIAGTYFFNARRVGGDFPWHENSLPAEGGVPPPAEFSARWIFDGAWDPCG